MASFLAGVSSYLRVFAFRAPAVPLAEPPVAHPVRSHGLIVELRQHRGADVSRNGVGHIVALGSNYSSLFFDGVAAVVRGTTVCEQPVRSCKHAFCSYEHMYDGAHINTLQSNLRRLHTRESLSPFTMPHTTSAVAIMPPPPPKSKHASLQCDAQQYTTHQHILHSHLRSRGVAVFSVVRCKIFCVLKISGAWVRNELGLLIVNLSGG